VVTSRPQLTPGWRIEPNLASRLDLTETGTNIAGMRVNVGSEIKPVLDPVISNQITALQSRLRNDATIERTAREQWSRMCGSIPLGGDKTGLPPLWLEMRPVRATAAQPQIDGRNLTIAIGVQAETRILRTIPSRIAHSRRGLSWCPRCRTALLRSAWRSTCRSPSSIG
jgi:Domain of unknown function (DUF4403)